MQLFMYRDRGLTRAFTERAQAAGYKALVLTVDNQVLGQRERDLVNGFAIPPRVTVRNSLDMVLRVPWLMRMCPTSRASPSGTTPTTTSSTSSRRDVSWTHDQGDLAFPRAPGRGLIELESNGL
jgi:isopentenyl diphosphate isomerase/L-lactate dehydrogenase-like FMN-dependent dehydrogenase